MCIRDRYATGARELYDLRHDPDEIDNLADHRPAVVRHLAHQVTRLQQCRASGCRKAEDRSVPG